MKSREIIDRNIEFWIKKRPALEAFFDFKNIKDTIDICEIATEGSSNKKVLITNFISGVALSYDYLIYRDGPCDPKANELIKPVMDLVADCIQSDEYRIDLIKQKITGMETLSVDGVTTPIVPEELLLFIKGEKLLPLTAKEIPQIKVDWLESKRNQHRIKTTRLKSQLKDKTTELKENLILDPILAILINEINFKYREKFKTLIEQLNESKVNPQKVNKEKFTAIASIFYNMMERDKSNKSVRWISRGTAFAEWLRIFSEAYHRTKPSYKETQVKACIEIIRRKAPFLDNLPTI